MRELTANEVECVSGACAFMEGNGCYGSACGPCGCAPTDEGGFFDAMFDVLGKIWTLPNTIVGALIGLAGVPFGATIDFGNNAIQFENYPWGAGGALTIGNVILYHDVAPIDLVPRYDNSGVVVIGDHEEAHTLQYQALGPAFALAYFISGGAFSASSGFEKSADNYAGGTGGWWPY